MMLLLTVWYNYSRDRVKQFTADTWPRTAAVCILNTDILSCVRCLSFTARCSTACAKTAGLCSSAQTHIPWICVAALTCFFPPLRKLWQEGGWFATTVQMRCGGKREVVSMDHTDGKRELRLKRKELMNKRSSWHGEQGNARRLKDTVKEKRKKKKEFQNVPA